MYTDDIMDLRKQYYKSDLRGRYIQFLEHIHDMVRVGDVVQLSTPLSVFWGITEHCNLNCKHCYASEFMKKDTKDMDIDRAKKIVDILYNLNIGELILEGGEPSLYKYFIELLIYIKQKDIPLTILSNGLCTDLEIDYINKYLDSYDAIQISMDGTKEECDALRGNGTFERTMDTISKLTCSIIINCVVTESNLKTLKELCTQLYNFKNIRSFHLSPLMHLGKGKDLNKSNIEDSIHILQELKLLYGNWISGTTIEDIEILKKNPALIKDMNHVKLGCCAGRSKLYINANGMVFPCDYMQKGMGYDLLKSDFMTLWTKNWKQLITRNQNISLEMKKRGVLLPYCSNMEI